MEAPVPPNSDLDPLHLLTSYDRGRKAVQPLPTLEDLYLKSHRSSALFGADAERQVELIQERRAGDLIAYGYTLEDVDSIDCMCVCGEHMTLTKRVIQRHLVGTGEAPYFAPVGKKRIPAPDDTRERYACPHVEQKLSAAYPAHYRAWQAMKRQVQTRVSMFPATVNKMRIEKAWFHKVSGFARFVLDTGLPHEEGLELRKIGGAGQFTRGSYLWTDAAAQTTARAQYPELSHRYYALRTAARKQHRYFQWEDFPSFVQSVKPPDTFNEDPSLWRLCWKSPAVEGYTDRNHYWQKLKKMVPAKGQPWNDIARAEEINQALPLGEYRVTLEQYTEALIGLGMLLSDPNTVGNSVEDMIDEAISTARGQ